MKPFAFLALAAVGLAACQEPSSPSAPGDKPAAPEVSAKAQKGELIPGQYVVVFRRDVRDVKSAAKALAGKHGAKLKRTYEAALKGMAIELPDSAAAALRQDPAVEFVEQNQVVRLTADPIVQPGATEGLDRIDQRFLPLSGTYGYSTSGAGVHVYILDTGLNFGHIDFSGRAVLGTDVSWFTTHDGVDCNGHGTHVAGTIGGTTYGVAKKVQLVVVRGARLPGGGQHLHGASWDRLGHHECGVAGGGQHEPWHRLFPVDQPGGGELNRQAQRGLCRRGRQQRRRCLQLLASERRAAGAYRGRQRPR